MTGAVLLDFEAILNRADSRGDLEQLELDLVKLSFLFANNFEFRQFIRSKFSTFDEAVDQVISLASFSRSQTFADVLYLIISEGYFNSIQWISDQITTLVSERSGRYLVVLGSSRLLTEVEQTEVGQRISSAVGRSVTLRNDVDPNLIGGSFIRLPDGKVFDYSLKRQLSEFKSYLMEKV